MSPRKALPESLASSSPGAATNSLRERRTIGGEDNLRITSQASETPGYMDSPVFEFRSDRRCPYTISLEATPIIHPAGESHSDTLDENVAARNQSDTNVRGNSSWNDFSNGGEQ